LIPPAVWDLTISKPNLLELILQKTKEDTIIFSKKNKKKDNHKEGTRLKEKTLSVTTTQTKTLS
jgi:hypothetical protein